MIARALGAEVRDAAAVMCDLSVLLGSEPVRGLNFQSYWRAGWVAFVTVSVEGQADSVLRLLEDVGGRLTAYDDDFNDEGRTRWIVQWRGVEVHVVGALRPAAPRPTSGLSFAYYTVAV